MRTALVTLSLLGFASAKLDLYSSRGFLSQAPPQEWPPVHFPSSFKIQFTAHTLSADNSTLVPFKNTTAYQYVDSEGNRELTVAQALTDDYGMQTFGFYYDAPQGKVTYKIPETSFCAADIDIGVKLNISEAIERARDPEGGITQYLGTTTLPYATHELHWFQLTMDTPQGTKQENLYFCTERLQLVFVHVVGEALINAIHGGMVETVFSDADFAQWEKCDAALGGFIADVKLPISLLF